MSRISGTRDSRILSRAVAVLLKVYSENTVRCGVVPLVLHTSHNNTNQPMQTVPRSAMDSKFLLVQFHCTLYAHHSILVKRRFAKSRFNVIVQAI